MKRTCWWARGKGRGDLRATYERQASHGHLSVVLRHGEGSGLEARGAGASRPGVADCGRMELAAFRPLHRRKGQGAGENTLHLVTSTQKLSAPHLVVPLKLLAARCTSFLPHPHPAARLGDLPYCLVSPLGPHTLAPYPQGGAGKTLPGVFFFYDLSPIKVRGMGVAWYPASFDSPFEPNTQLPLPGLCLASHLPACYSCMPITVEGSLAYIPHRIRYTHAGPCLPLSVPPTLAFPPLCAYPLHPPLCTPLHPRAQVRIVERSSSFLSFLTSVCAIVGGVFTVSGIVDAFIYTSTRLIKKKMELGKFS